jgi:transposase
VDLDAGTVDEQAVRRIFRYPCLFSKKLERGRFIWPSPADGAVTITPAQLGYLLEGIDWRMPQTTWRPTATG